jgi:hypothetical protein
MSASPCHFSDHQVLLKSYRGLGGDLAHLRASPERPWHSSGCLPGSLIGVGFRTLGAVSCRFSKLKSDFPALDQAAFNSAAMAKALSRAACLWSGPRAMPSARMNSGVMPIKPNAVLR